MKLLGVLVVRVVMCTCVYCGKLLLFVCIISLQMSGFFTVGRNTQFADRVDYGVQIQLRFCLTDSSTKQPDCFPANITVKVNNMVAQLPVSTKFTSSVAFVDEHVNFMSQILCCQ